MRSAGLVIGVWLALAAPAFAQGVQALSPRAAAEAPVLNQGQVLWSAPAGLSVRVFSRPAAGGPVSAAGQATLTAAEAGASSWRLAARGGQTGLWVSPDNGRSNVLFSGPFTGELARVRETPRGALAVATRDFWPWAAGYVTLERTRNTLQPMVTSVTGFSRALPLPTGADPSTLAVTESLAAVLVDRQRVVVLDITSGVVVRNVPLGAARDYHVTSLSVAADGALALTADSGADVLAWAPVGAQQFEVVMTGDRFGLVQVAGGRIAFVAPGGKVDAARPVVVEPRTGGEPTLIFRGPPAFQVESLEFDGVHVAWATQACQFVAKAEPAASTVTVPAGPCARTEVSITSFAAPEIPRRNPSLPVYVRCLAAPTARCRLDVRAYRLDGERLGRLRTTVPRGARRLLRVPLGRRDADRLRRADDNPTFFIIRTIDPDGKIRRLGPI